MSDPPQTAPAAHLVSIEADPNGGGLLVGHLLCNSAPSFVPNMPGQRYALAIDVAQAVVHHRCPPGQGDQPTDWGGSG